MDEKLDELKREINNFLWVNLPRSATLGEADNVAVEVHSLVSRLWRRDYMLRGEKNSNG